MSTPLTNKPPQRRSGIAGWVTFAIAVVLVIAGMAALAGPGLIQTATESPDTGSLFAKYFTDLDTAWNNRQIKTEGIYQNLKKKGEDAQAYATAGEITLAQNELNALLNELSAQAGNQVQEPDATTLAADVQAIIDELNRPTQAVPGDTATVEEGTPEGTTLTPEEVTASPTVEPVIVTASPTVTSASPTWSPTPPSGLFTIDSYRVGCSQTVITGRFGENTPAVRATVNLASNLNIMLDEGVAQPAGLSVYEITLSYPPQPEGTRLIVAVGEWDGAKYMNPATLQGFDCTDKPSIGIAPDASPTFTPSPTPSFVYFPPPPSPTGGGRLEAWAISQDPFLVTVCNGAVGPAVMASFLEFSPNNVLTAIILEKRRWQMFPTTNDPNTYQGSYETADSTQKIKDDISLKFTSDHTFTGSRISDVTYANGINDCHVESTWTGSKQP